MTTTGSKAFIVICLVTYGAVSQGNERNPKGSDLNIPVQKRTDDNDDNKPAALSVVHINKKIQQDAGVQVATLEPFQYTPEISAYGNAPSLQPLLELRNRYLSAQAQHQGLRAKLTLAKQNRDRTRRLQRSGVASQRVLQEQQSQLQLERAQAQGMHQQIKAIYDETLVNWGRKLTEVFLSNDTDQLTPYLSGLKTLLLISLPAGQTLPDGVVTIQVSPTGNRSDARPAELISLAPQTDTITQGESYFFATGHPAVRTGMRIGAWLPRQQAPESGVLIPASALIWHLGRAFVYLKTGEENFTRRPIARFVNSHAGYFVQEGLTPGEQLVTVGAQMLLSEEFRGQIPDEDDD